MGFAENLQFLRKEKNITQEQLAELLEVSRQSVSKWESGASFPEMEKILQICSMFHCSMDTLMQGDVSSEFAKDVHGYDKFKNRFSRAVTLGMGLIIFGFSCVCLLNGIGIEENLSNVVFFIFLIISVMIFVVMGMEDARFREKYPQIENFYTEEEKEQAYRKYTIRIALGVCIILIGMLLMLAVDSRLDSVTAGVGSIVRPDDFANGIFLLMVTAAVSILVYGGMQKEKYNIAGYNKEGNPSPERKKRDALIWKINACIMLVTTGIFLVFSFITDKWQWTWLFFVVGGLLCAVVKVMISKDGE